MNIEEKKIFLGRKHPHFSLKLFLKKIMFQMQCPEKKIMITRACKECYYKLKKKNQKIKLIKKMQYEFRYWNYQI